MPDKVLTNEDLNKENPAWEMENVFKKSGVIQRHIAEEGETALDLSCKACDKIFDKKENKRSEIDGIIYCTQSPDYIMPPNAFLLHKYLGLSEEVFAFDFNHACTGYIYSLTMAHSFISANLAKKVLLVNADTYSKYINKADRSARVLFGDGAAASIIEKADDCRGIIDVILASSGKKYDNFYIPAGGLRLPKSIITSKTKMDDKGNVRSKNDIYMNGIGVWAFINSVVPKQIIRLLERNKLTKADIDLFEFCQASQMTLESPLLKF